MSGRPLQKARPDRDAKRKEAIALKRLKIDVLKANVASAEADGRDRDAVALRARLRSVQNQLAAMLP